jgi:two-component system NtrC family response regulator
MKPRLLIVDDQEELRTQMRWALVDDYEVAPAEDRAGARSACAELRPPVVLLDLGLPPHPNDTTEGFLTMAEILAQAPDTKVIVVTGQGERHHAMQAIGAGAYDFLCKPVQTDEIRIILKRAFYVADLERQVQAASQQDVLTGFEGILGTSPQMQAIFTTIRKVATTDAPVLVLGESGTGKEMVAQAIHRRSARQAGPFVAINCSAIPEALLESELFGHEKGAYTGAHQQRKGRFEMAAGGTLFLDEIGELPTSLQVKLLRFLQEQRIERVGGRESIAVDTRIIAATNMNLQQAMQAQRFREDLFYRLAVVVIHLPALRERDGDILFLAKAFLKKFAPAHHPHTLNGFQQQALQAMTRYDWPGNVREMENRIRRATIMADGRLISLADLDLSSVSAATGLQSLTLREARDQLDKEMIERAHTHHKGKISAMAEELGISRPTLYELMDKLSIKRP